MNLSERKLAAKKFMETWKGRGYEKGESQTFWLTLLRDVLGVEHPEDIVSFESQVKLSSTSFIDAYISTTKVLIEQKSIDKDLRAPIRQSDGTLLTPFGQAKRYASELPLSMHPRYVVTCNFKSFLVYDMENPQAEPEEVLLENLDREFSRLNFLVDGASGPFQKELEVSIRAGEHVGEIYDALLPEFGSSPTAEDLHSLNVLCVRLVFCLYAEDAGIFEKEQFYLYLKSFRPENMRMALKDLFLTLDTPEPLRDKFLEPKLKNFPYVNGSLFRMRAEESIPPITEEIATVLLNRASLNFDWSEISPTIFGAVFESTLNPETRRSGGMHYTSIENIHKVIDPLFLDSFRAELEKIKKISGAKKRGAELLNFQRKLGSLKFLDPACGSGNFLTETYLSLRTLENEALSLRLHGEAVLDVYGDSIFVHLGQFYGIEINDFAVTVAKTALWIAESQMMEKTSEILQRNLEFLPLKTNANIVEGNALRMDWNLGNRSGELGDRREELGNRSEELGDRGEELGYGGEDEKLRGSDGLAKSHGFGRGNLLAGEDASQGRTVFFARSNETGGNIDSVEYCGRFRSQESERVLSVSAHCAGVGNGVGNTIENLRPDTISDRGTNRKSHGFVDSGRQNECGASNSSELTSRSLSPTSQYDYIMGNPPFVGARLMNAEQKKDVLSVFGNVKNAGNLDYVSCWYKKTADMLKGSSTKAALVSTNSITQGEQPAILWKPLMQEGIEIDFAYRTFRWDSESAQKAHVHCVIVGFGMGKDPLAMTDAGRVSTQSAKENALKSSPSERQVSESFAKSLKSSFYEPQENDAFAKFPKSSSYETQENDASAKSQECSLSETLGHDASPHRETVRSDASSPKFIFTESGEKIPAKNINAYLVDAPNVFIESRKKPLCDVPEIGIGNKPIDGGNYLFTEEEMRAFVEREPRSEKYFRKWLGSDEFINGYFRYCLWLGDADPQELVKMPLVMERVKAVRNFRLASKSAPTQKLAETPTRFHVENMPSGSYILIPRVSSERRFYIPIGFVENGILCSDSVHVLDCSKLDFDPIYVFGILTSSVHMAWTRAVCGRLKSDYRYSKDIVYNNFPWPVCGSRLSVVGGQWSVDGRNLEIGGMEEKENGEKLQGVAGLAGGDFDSVEHCGRTRQNFDPGISAVSLDCQGIGLRTGNANFAGRENRLSCAIGNSSGNGETCGGGENAQRLDRETERIARRKNGSVVCPTADCQSLIAETAKAVLTARAKYPNCSLAELYGENMFLFPELEKAHKENDRAVMRAYGFDERMTESEIVAALFEMHRNLVAGG